MASSSRALAKRPQVDPLDEPSAEWGWHGSFPRGTRLAAVVVAILLPLLLIGHHASWTEILWMCVPSLFIIGALVAGSIKQRHAWRR